MEEKKKITADGIEGNRKNSTGPPYLTQTSGASGHRRTRAALSTAAEGRPADGGGRTVPRARNQARGCRNTPVVVTRRHAATIGRRRQRLGARVDGIFNPPNVEESRTKIVRLKMLMKIPLTRFFFFFVGFVAQRALRRRVCIRKSYQKQLCSRPTMSVGNYA